MGGPRFKTGTIQAMHMMGLRLKSAPQVLLLPNFTMIVARALRVLDGFDTIDLLEQALHSV